MTCTESVKYVAFSGDPSTASVAEVLMTKKIWNSNVLDGAIMSKTGDVAA